MSIVVTASERRSLQALKAPHWLKSESLPFPRPYGDYEYSTDTLPKEASPPLHSLPDDNALFPLLEGKVLTRHRLNPRVILAVGEYESFAHLPGVGTRWQIGFPAGKLYTT